MSITERTKFMKLRVTRIKAGIKIRFQLVEHGGFVHSKTSKRKLKILIEMVHFKIGLFG